MELGNPYALLSGEKQSQAPVSLSSRFHLFCVCFHLKMPLIDSLPVKSLLKALLLEPV